MLGRIHLQIASLHAPTRHVDRREGGQSHERKVGVVWGGWTTSRSCRWMYWVAPATATAPAGSRMERLSLKTASMAPLMARLSTISTPSNSSRHRRKDSAPTCSPHRHRQGSDWGA